MTPEILEANLRAWGSFYGERPMDDEATEPWLTGRQAIHPLVRAKEMAPGTRALAIRVRTTMDRGGQARRRLMARELGPARVRLVPGAFVDPVPCVESRPVVGTPRRDPRYTESVRLMQEAWYALRRQERTQAEALRQEYQVRGITQREKAAHMGIDVRRYRDLLLQGKRFIRNRIG